MHEIRLCWLDAEPFSHQPGSRRHFERRIGVPWNDAQHAVAQQLNLAHGAGHVRRHELNPVLGHARHGQ